MEIKKAIGQKKPFRNSRHKAMVNILFTQNWIWAKLRAFFKPFGITEKQYNILRILKGADKPLSTSVIRNRLLDKMSDTTRVIDRMLKKGYVSKKTNEMDRRLVDIALTDMGHAKLKEIDANIDKLDELMNGLSNDEANKLSDLLDAMRSEE